MRPCGTETQWRPAESTSTYAPSLRGARWSLPIGAKQMTAYYVPGDRDRPEWWGTHDEAILRGEVSKLAELPPAGSPQPDPFVPGAAVPTARPWWRTPREIGALILFGALLGLILLVAFTSPRSTARQPADITTPTTYGPPGPTGGPR